MAVVAAEDGAQLARVQLSRVVIYALPALREVTELTIEGCAARNDVAFAGKKLVLLARGASSQLHVIDLRTARKPRLLGLLELRGAARILAAATRHVLVATPSATMLVDVETLGQVVLPMHGTVTAAARLAGERFLIARDGLLEEWDADTCTATRRLQFDRRCDPKFIGGNSLRWWMIPRSDDAQIDVVSLARDTVQRHALAESARYVSVHPHGDLVLAIGAETGMPFVIDLARRLDPVTRVGLPAVDEVTWIDRGRRFVFAPIGGALALQRPHAETTLQAAAAQPAHKLA